MASVNRIEIIAPAGSWAMLNAAIDAGVDSVYFGIKQLNMRINADNFEMNELKKITEKCHFHGVKAYLTLNSIIFDEERKTIIKIIDEAVKASIDAVICWDQLVIQQCLNKGMPFHISTQASVSNSIAAEYYSRLGAKRIVLARECSLKQIKTIYKHLKYIQAHTEIEAFVHGAMCVAVSGRCFTSQFLYNKSANRGDCIQPCRKYYNVTDLETDKELVLLNNFVMSARDMCTIGFIDKLIKNGIKAFKIEGRSRNPEYVKVTVECYRYAVESVYNGNYNEVLVNELITKLKTVYNRKFSDGFYFGMQLPGDFTDISGSDATEKKVYLGVVKKYFQKLGVAEIKIEGETLNKGDIIMIQGNNTGVFRQSVESIEVEHKKISSISKGSKVGIKVVNRVRKNDKVFKVI